ncbi:M23 family metallopeptidase [Nitrospirillum sp. BR 11828]|uniref:M23 family metallopeptidase n=1 Tax=Nitrospirillum sp. BR 11828 TaxID=3104325 RepID=UPI002ACA6764|nr:M23 family metallopeptidase [Nitrospirillum sp. BR 11828]MDZ5648011.1 M23 family metallopeptidase [Nitrospirillum sp. BR 11828]
MVRHPLVQLLLLSGLLVAAFGARAEPDVHSITPLDIHILRPASVVPATDGPHLVFEALISNFSPVPMTLSSVRLGTAAQPAALARFEDAALATLLSRPGRPPGDGQPPVTVIQGNTFAAALFDLPLGDDAPVADLRLALTIAPFKPDLPDTTLNTAVAVPVDRTPPVIVSAPVAGTGWVAFNGLSATSIHRTTLMVVDGQARVPERYAIDFMKLTGDGREFRGDQARNESWPGYGQAVLAVADGVIESVRDGFPDNVPGRPPAQKVTLDTIAGNQVILRLKGGAYAAYAHLIPGSIPVRPGQAVRQGQVLGRLGNSGQSDAPHLHFQVGDRGHIAATDGLPFVFDAFTLLGVVADTAAADAGGAWTASQVPQPRRRQLPAENAVIGF